MKKTLLFAVGITLSAVAIFALDLSFYNSFETFCMGEAYTAIANGANGLSYNPAGLTTGKGFVLKLPNASLGMSYGAASATIKAVTHIDEITSILQSGNNLEIAKYFLDNYADALFGRNDILAESSAYVGYEGNRFALVAFAMGQGYATSFVSNDIVPFVSLHAAAAAYGGISGAFSLSLGKAVFSIGGNYRYGYVMPKIYSIENQSVLTVNSSTFDPDLEYFPNSNGDVGFQISYDDFKIGTLFHNVGATDENVRIGVGYISKKFAADVDLEKPFDSEYSFFRKLHIGVSYSPFTFLHLYGGVSSGMFTGGLKLDIGPLSMCVGSYILNYGPYAGYDSQRMYTISMGL